MTKTITFASKTYALEPAIGLDRAKVIFLQDNDGKPELSGPELVELYNLVSANLGRGRVKRFATPAAGVKRTWKLLEEYEAEWEALDNPSMLEAPEDLEDPQPKDPEPKQKKAQLSASEKAAIKQEASDRKAAGEGSKVERWRTPKRREPSKVCYKPRPGSKQAVAYELLTRKGGIRVEDFCSEMSKLDTSGKNTTEWKEPGTIWGGLNYLFVSQKGYGLEFDGERIRLIIGAEERDPSSKKDA